MKGCFVLQRRFAYIAHDIIVHLKKKYGLTQFCGYVFLRSTYDFLRTQKEVNYTSLILDEDIHNRYKNEILDLDFLTRLEKDYGIPNFWPYLAVDRIIMSDQIVREYPHNTSRYSHEDMLKILQVNAKAIIEFLDKEKPDYLFTTQPGGVGSYLLYHIAKKRGIKTLVMILPSIENKITVSEDYDFITGVDEIYKKNLEQGVTKNKYYSVAKKYVGSFRNKPRTYSQMHTGIEKKLSLGHQFKFLMPWNYFNSLSWLFKLFMRHWFSNDRNDYTSINPWNYIKDHIKRKMRNLFNARGIYDYPIVNEPYAFFGLHLEPEVSLLLLAPFVADQVWLIKQIARSLPVGYKLYVKDHPHMAIYRPSSYYKDIKKIPNVRLINPSVTGFELIKNAKLVTSITGSIGFEGVLLNKPVITFGHAFYNRMSLITHCKTIEELPHIIKSKLAKFKPDDNELLAYVSAIFEDSADVDILYVWENERDEVKKRLALVEFADLLAKKIGVVV
ncbi:MAG: hypothetical protein NUV47_04090 [Patescibacteria group bacterium]|nr:hypothetical protein [Patescibacteria group bacterium]